MATKAPLDLPARIRRQLALGIHPATGAALTELERAFYLALLAGLPGMRERVTELYAARAAVTSTVPLSITE
jgi:hypothetical protein